MWHALLTLGAPILTVLVAVFIVGWLTPTREVTAEELDMLEAARWVKNVGLKDE
jgi:hypothetical protein